MSEFKVFKVCCETVQQTSQRENFVYSLQKYEAMIKDLLVDICKYLPSKF